MGRFYVCPVIGMGTPEDVFRPAIADKGVRHWTACIDNIPRGEVGEGTPRLSWSVVWADTENWTEVDADPTLVNLGDMADSGLLSKSVPTGIKTALRRTGVMTVQEVNSLTDVRSLLRTLVQKHYPYADETKAFPETK